MAFSARSNLQLGHRYVSDEAKYIAIQSLWNQEPQQAPLPISGVAQLATGHIQIEHALSLQGASILGSQNFSVHTPGGADGVAAAT